MAQQNINVNMSGNSSGLVSAVNAASSALKGLTTVATNSAKGLGMVAVAGSKVTAGLAKIGASIPIGAFNLLGNGVKKLTGWLGDQNKALSSSAAYYKGLVGQVANMNRFINVLGSSVRQIGQGLQNFGTSFTIYVSAPIAAFIYSMTSGFLDFQDKMIEVRRTTGLTMDQVDELQKRIQVMSLTSPTSVEDLAAMAAEWGKLGISVPADIAKLTESADHLKVATDLTSEQVVNDLGKIGAIYFKSSDELAANYDKLASAINELGQASPVSESDIISAFQRVAPVGKLLDVPIDQLLALSTASAERSASPERGGTQLARALTQGATNLKDFGSALGKTQDEVKAMIDENPIEFFLNMADAISHLASNTDKIRVAEELFGGVGSKAVESLAANLPGLYNYLKLANEAYNDGTSIQKEYLRSTDSVKTQLGILQNNFRYLGYTIAQQVLPYITKFAEVAIPPIQAVASSFSSLSEQTKVLVVGLGALLAVIGPITIFLGSFLFSIGIITTGVTSFLTQIIGLGVGLAKFALAIVGILNPIELVIIAITGIGAAFLYVTNQAESAGNLLVQYIGKFAEWGHNLMMAFGQGIASATQDIRNVVVAVINNFIGLIQAFSPPKEGPLKGIQSWGKGLMGAYADGIEEGGSSVQVAILKNALKMHHQIEVLKKSLSATSVDTGASITEGVAKGAEVNLPAVKRVMDALVGVVDDADQYIITIGSKFSDSFAKGLEKFSSDSIGAFTDIFGKVRGVVEAVGKNLGLDDNVIDKNILRAGDAVKSLIESFQGNGKIGNLKSIYDLLGGMGGQTDALVKAQLEYNNATKDLDRIKKQNDGVDDSLRKQIEAISARNDLTIDQKTALIRNARFRASHNKDQLKDEEKAAQERVDNAKDELTKRQQILDTLVSLTSAADKEKKKKTKDDGVDDLPGFNPDAFKQGMANADGSMSKLFSNTTEKLGTFFDGISKAKSVWAGFWAGLTGNMPGVGQLSEYGKDFWSGFVPGNNIHLAWKNFMDSFTGFHDTITSIKDEFKRLFDIIGAGTTSGYLGLEKDNLDNFNLLEKIIYNIGYYFGIAADNAQKLFNIWSNNFSGFSEGYDKSLNRYPKKDATAKINSFNEQEPGARMAEALNETLRLVFGDFKLDQTTVTAFVYTLLTQLFDFVNNFDFRGIGGFATALVNGIINGITAYAIDSADNHTGLELFVKNFVQAIFNFFGSINWAGTADTAGLGEGIAAIIHSILSGITLADWTPLEKGITGLVDGIFAIFNFQINGTSNLDKIAEILGRFVNLISDIMSKPEFQMGLAIAAAHLGTAIAEVLQKIDWSVITSDLFGGLSIAIGAAIQATDWSKVAWGLVNLLLGGIVGIIMGAANSSGATDRMQKQYNSPTTTDGFPIMGTGQDLTQNGLINNDGSMGWLLKGLNWLGGGGFKNPLAQPSQPSSQSNPGPSSGWGAPATSFGPVGSEGTLPSTSLPLVLSPDALKQATMTGSTLQDSIVQGATDNLSSPDTALKLSGGLQTLLTNVTVSSATTTSGFGDELGNTTMNGFVARLTSTKATKELDTSWAGSLQQWVKDRDASIQNIGDDVGGKVIKGFSLQTSNTGVYMDGWSKSMQTWASNSNNTKGISDSGYIIGGSIVSGTLKSVRDAMPLIGSAFSNFFSNLSVDDSWIDTEVRKYIFAHLNPTQATPASVPAVASIASVGISPMSNTNANTFVINIEGGTPQDEKSMKKIADMIYEKMRKETALKKSR